MIKNNKVQYMKCNIIFLQRTALCVYLYHIYFSVCMCMCLQHIIIKRSQYKISLTVTTKLQYFSHMWQQSNKVYVYRKNTQDLKRVLYLMLSVKWRAVDSFRLITYILQNDKARSKWSHQPSVGSSVSCRGSANLITHCNSPLQTQQTTPSIYLFLFHWMQQLSRAQPPK